MSLFEILTQNKKENECNRSRSEPHRRDNVVQGAFFHISLSLCGHLTQSAAVHRCARLQTEKDFTKLKGFYLVWNRRAEKRTDFSGKTARRLLTLLYIRPFVCSVYISIPPYPPPPTPPQPSLPPGANTQYQIQMPLAASCKSSWVNQSHRCRDGESWQVKDLGASW